MGSVSDALTKRCGRPAGMKVVSWGFSAWRSPSNPLGVKGVGEVGPSGAAAAIGNAVAHALGRGARVNALPLTPERIFFDATRHTACAKRERDD